MARIHIVQAPGVFDEAADQSGVLIAARALVEKVVQAADAVPEKQRIRREPQEGSLEQCS